MGKNGWKHGSIRHHRSTVNNSMHLLQFGWIIAIDGPGARGVVKPITVSAARDCLTRYIALSLERNSNLEKKRFDKS